MEKSYSIRVAPCRKPYVYSVHRKFFQSRLFTIYSRIRLLVKCRPHWWQAASLDWLWMRCGQLSLTSKILKVIKCILHFSAKRPRVFFSPDTSSFEQLFNFFRFLPCIFANLNVRSEILLAFYLYGWNQVAKNFSLASLHMKHCMRWACGTNNRELTETLISTSILTRFIRYAITESLFSIK